MLNPQGLIRERWGTGLDRAWDRLPNMEQSGQWKEHFVCEETVGAPHPPYAPFPPWQEAGRGGPPHDFREGSGNQRLLLGSWQGIVSLAQALHIQMEN